MDEEFRCLGFGVAKDFVTDLVVEGSKSGLRDFSLAQFWSSLKIGLKS